MGIDVYARWKGMTEEEEKAQYTGFSVEHGHVGYLREAYHGRPYATRVLVPEAFTKGDESTDGWVSIPASVLRERLQEVVKVAIEREEKVYDNKVDRTSPTVKSYIDFVELCERKERETGEPVEVYVSY